MIPRGRANSTDAVNIPDAIKRDPPKLPFEPDMIQITSDGQVIVGRMVADCYCSAGYC